MAPYMTRQPVDWAAYMTWRVDFTFQCEQETYTMTAYSMSRKRVYKRREKSRWSTLQYSSNSPSDLHKIPTIPLKQTTTSNIKMTPNSLWKPKELEEIEAL
jgi:hypothetical protein